MVSWNAAELLIYLNSGHIYLRFAELHGVPAGAQNAFHSLPSLQHPLIQTMPS